MASDLLADLTGKTALVTGGGSGIGRAAALLFAQRGAQVAVVDINTDSGAETARQINAAHGDATAIYIQTDVAQEAQVVAMVAEAVRAFGRLDYAFNNAGVSGRSPLHETSEALWDRVVGVDLKGVWLCMKYEIGYMLAHGGGAIVNTSSVAGLVGVDWGMAPYVASKHGVIGLTKAAALEYATRNIRVNAVCPGTIETPLLSMSAPKDYAPLHPMQRIGQPSEVAQAVVWLCSDAASFITGVALPVDGGWTAR